MNQPEPPATGAVQPFFTPFAVARLHTARRVLIIRSAAWPVLHEFVRQLRALPACPQLAVMSHCADRDAALAACGTDTAFFGYPQPGAYRREALTPELLSAMQQYQPDEIVVLSNDRAGLNLERVYELAWPIMRKALLVFQQEGHQLVTLADPVGYCAAARDLTRIKWWHQVPLPDGRVTPGACPIYRYDDAFLFSSLQFAGKTVLDIGCWDGYFSFMAAQRGARRVVALDNPDYRWGGMAGFQFLQTQFPRNVEFRLGSVYALPPEEFDIVLCYGVLYHLSDPLAAFHNCCRVAGESVLVEGLICHDDKPRLELIPPGHYHGDPSNVYLLSDSFLSAAAAGNGFAPVASHPRGPTRSAMRFDRIGQPAAHYPGYCYPLPPL
ncbi:MAG TPA: DUF1698 domain-containing protein [bacterium]|nr:DUF1698 domain-containing protein [bacterium]